MQKNFYINNIVMCVAILLFTACTDQTSTDNSEYCLNTKQSCAAEQFQQAHIEISQPLELEQPIALKLQLPSEWSIHTIKAALRGANMQMGHMPIQFKASKKPNEFTGEMLIVACTQANMVWRLEVEVESDHSNQPHLLHWTFSAAHME